MRAVRGLLLMLAIGFTLGVLANLVVYGYLPCAEAAKLGGVHFCKLEAK